MEDTRASGLELPSPHSMPKKLDQLLSRKKRGKDLIILCARGCFWYYVLCANALKIYINKSWIAWTNYQIDNCVCNIAGTDA